MESFNGKLRDELLDREIFDTLLEAKVLTERWRQEYITVRPHSSLGYRPPAPTTRIFTHASLPDAFNNCRDQQIKRRNYH